MSPDGGIGNDATVADDDAPAPRTSRPSLTGYDVGGTLGAGGMGEVLLARDTRIGRDVAIKQLLATAPDDDAVARFLREAKIQARLDHPSIVPVYELGEDVRGVPYFAMKRLAGVTLAARIADPAADTRTLLNAFVAVCAAIDFAHARRVVHRDLKPANVMLGAYREVYVLDWGIARVLDDSELGAAGARGDDAAATEVGSVIGTPLYMAPEQARGEVVDGAADVFALGAILFEILARQPLGGAAALDTLGASPARRAPDRAIAPELDAACVAALAAAPRDRPTAHALGERVQRYLDGDRDLAARRALAADQLAVAHAAAARGDRAAAMQAAGRALGLDPESEAASLIGRLLVEPPREMPAEVATELEHIDCLQLRAQARNGAVTMMGTFLLLPFFAVLHVTSWALIGAMVVTTAVALATLVFTARRARPDQWLIVVPVTALVVVLARLFSPFLLVPASAAITAVGWCAAPPRLDHPIRAALLSCAGVAIALALELTGAVSPTVHVADHAIAFTSAGFDMGDRATEVLLATAVLGSTMFAGQFSRRIALQRRAAVRELQLQAWHLRKMVAPEPGGSPAAAQV